MNALVLGGLGFIGSHLVERLLSQGHRVRVYDRVEPAAGQQSAGVDYVLGELGNHGLLREALPGIECVFHLACTTLPKSSNDDPRYDVRSNVVDSIQLFEECVRAGVRRVVFISSGGTVYGASQQTPIPETHPTDPLCSYGITKLAIEKYLGLFHHEHGLDYRVVRPANAYGERQPLHRQQGAIGVFLASLAKNEPIEIWGDGRVVRDYVHAGDVADALLLAGLSTDDRARVFNIGSGVGTSLLELVEKLRAITDRQPNVIMKPARPFDIPVSVLDIARAKSVLGWTPAVSIEEGLARTWRWIVGKAR